MSSVKATALFSQESINLVSSNVCCSSNYVQPFPGEKIKAFQERMYNKTSFEFRYHMKLDVHRQVHCNSARKRMVTVEGIDVCLSAWRFMSGVSKTTFHRFQAYAKNGKLSQPHGNMGTQKTRKHTLQATATLKHMLDKSADHMPHKTHTLLSGEKVVSWVPSATFKWNETISEINTVNVVFGLKEVFASNIIKIKKAHFSKFSAKKPRDNFARCSKCDNLKSLKRAASAPLKDKWSNELDEHLAVARSHCDQYYSNRHMSTVYPQEVLTIIHDKMDHAKTASPVFSHKSKQLDGLFKLPVSITGMIAHGHGDVRYAHYGLDIFSHNSNYTIGLLAKLLRDLEMPPTYSSRELFVGSGSAPLFQAILQGKDMCKTLLRSAPAIPVLALPLPPILNVQVDNTTGDNKNRFVFAFWSLLVAKKVFQEIYVSFMLVGHTHDDIDALFERWSMDLKKNNFLTIPSLMKSFMDVESLPVIPHLIEEVPDFKSFIEGHLLKGNEALVGHTKAQQFNFFLDVSGSLIMKYKKYCTNEDWLPNDSQGIKLWQEDSEGQSLWPREVPMPIAHHSMRNVEDISRGLSGFINYWETLCNDNKSGEYRRRHEHFIFYWQAVKACLQEPIQPSSLLRNGFWPSNQLQESVEDQLLQRSDSREEVDDGETYVGTLHNRPHQSFHVARDVYEGYFLAICPADGDTQHVWIARALSNPFSNPEHPNSVLIQYFRPTVREVNIQEYCTGWDSIKGLRWKVEETQDPIWEQTSTLMTAWKPKVKKDTVECVLKIPSAQIDVINKSLASYNSN